MISVDGLFCFLKFESSTSPLDTHGSWTCRDATLVTADGAFNFLLGQLSEMDTSLSKTFEEAIRKRIMERRQSFLSQLMQYLSNPKNSLEPRGDSMFSVSSRTTLAKTAKNVLEKLFKNGDYDSQNENEDNVNDESETLEEKLKNSIKKMTSPEPCTSKGLSFITKEMAVFEATCDMSKNLKKVYHALSTIPPTSVESERCFSLAGKFMSHDRTNMSDELFDSICFLNCFFKDMWKFETK